MRIGCSTITFGSQSLDEALERIADLGFTVIDVSAIPGVFDHVQLINPPAGEIEHAAKLVRAHGFIVAGLQSVPWHPDALDDPSELRRRYTVAADIAQAVGARAWIVDANRPEPGGPAGRAKGLERFKRTIAMAAELASERGLCLAVEAPHRGTLAENLSQVLELLEVSDIPELGIDVDTSHVLKAGAPTAEVLEAIGHRIVHVALRDGQQDGADLTPGDGDFDFAEFFALLSDTGYDGDATLELEPALANATADDCAREAVRARNYLRQLSAADGI
jgi:sugar phosphate isomerase/epimerase